MNISTSCQILILIRFLNQKRILTTIKYNFVLGYEKECQKSDGQNLPNLICVITGKGPLKEFYKAIVELRKWVFISVVTPWLENKDYPKILGIKMLH